MKRTVITLTTLKKISLIFVFTFVFSNAQSEPANTSLPFGLSWDSSIVEYVEAVQQHTNSSDYSITESSRDGIYLITQSENQEEYNIHYSAQYRGPSTTNVIKEYALRDLDGSKLKFEWMGVDYTPVSSEKNYYDFLQSDELSFFDTLLSDFEHDFGVGSAQYSYISTSNQNEVKHYYQIPQIGEAIDYPIILEFLSSNINNIDTFWLVVGNGNASCRLYLTTTQRRDGSAGLIWHLSYYFTQKRQELPQSDMLFLP